MPKAGIGGLVLAAFFLFCPPADAVTSPEAGATVVVFNISDPTSASLAKYYATRREIPARQIVGLSCPLTEEISRADFEAAIARPLREIFVKNGWWQVGGGKVTNTRIRFVAMMRGMPLKIRSEGQNVQPRADQPAPIGKRDEAAVDSEVACLGLGIVPPSGLVPNPYFRRFTPILEAITDPGLLLVCRLDAPTDVTVRAMIDDAISAERDGLWGWGYLDSRNIKSGGYAEGDEWLANLAGELRENGIPVLWDKAPETLPAGYPVTDAAVYYGWYAEAVNGPFADPLFRFRAGAVAVHIHSFSASTLRNPSAGWCGPLLEHGAAVTLGNVYEPYLTLTAHLDVFQDRLMAGFTFAESAYSAMRGLSWMGVAIGDPLYRPYEAWTDLTAGNKNISSSWQKYREIVLAADGNVTAAAPKLQQAAKETGKSMFLEALAAVQADSGQGGKALETLNVALAMEINPVVRFRLALEKIGLLRAAGRKSEAGTLVLEQKGKTSDPAQGRLLDAIYMRMFPPPPTPSPSKK